VLGLITIGGFFAFTYIHLMRKGLDETEKEKDEMLNLSQGRKRNNVNEIASGNNIRRCNPSDNGKRD
jgi:hypothetical protein